MTTDYFILGLSSSAHAAIRRVHSETPDRGRAHYAGKASNYLLHGGAAAATARGYRDCIERYIAWDGNADPAVDLPTKGLPISFGQGDIVRSRPDVVLGPDEQSGAYDVRVLLLDELRLDRRAAEMIALAAHEYVWAQFGTNSTALVNVWQLARGEGETVTATEAEGRRTEVEALLAAI
jgi:hypothetical protein